MKNNYKFIYLIGNDYSEILKKLPLKDNLFIVANDREFLNNQLRHNYKKILKERVIFLQYNNLKRKLLKIKSKYLISLSWRRFISKDITNKFTYAINIHPAILPFYKGIHPLPHILKNNEKFHGITAHLIEDQIDEGKIILIKKFRINKFSTIESLHDLYMNYLPFFIKRLIKKIESNKKIIFKNNELNKTKIFALKRSPRHSKIDSAKSLAKVYDDIRSCHQKKYPPFIIINGEKIFISLSRRLPMNRKKNKFDI